MSEENEVSLPKATIAKLVKEYLPPDARASADTIDKLLECCAEFVYVVSAAANEVATADKKTTITPEHVLRALEALGFAGHAEGARHAWEALKEESKNAPRLSGRRTKAEEVGMSEAEQIRLQQELFAAARARSMSLTEAQDASVRAQLEARPSAPAPAAPQPQEQGGAPPVASAGSMPPPQPKPPVVVDAAPPPQPEQQEQQQQQDQQQQPGGGAALPI